MKKNIFKSVYIGALFIVFTAIISCEKEFTDIGSNVISNTKFDTNSFLVDITVENSPVEKIQSDNISVQLQQYLLGVYNNPNYEKIEASIISQLATVSGLKVVDRTYGTDTTVVTKIDTVFIKIPYQATLKSTSAAGPVFELDSILGDQTNSFKINVYRSNTFINGLNPLDPSKVNRFYSNSVFEKLGSELNDQVDFEVKPNEKDTVLYIKRRLHDDKVFKTDTLKLLTASTSASPIPFVRIPLKKDKIKELFLDKYATGEFSSQTLLNNYFKGIILEAKGNDNLLVSFNFNSSSDILKPSLEVYYTNTILKSGTAIVDTITKRDSFILSGYRVNNFKMTDKVYPVNNQVKLQGAAGSEASINLFGPDNNNNGIADKIEELRAKNLLINDATLEIYVDESISSEIIPNRLYLYKSDASSSKLSQIKDAFTESGLGGIKGELVTTDNGAKEKYTFKLTDYLSDILSGKSNYSPTLKLKVFNSLDLPVTASDTIFRNYSWNPKAVTLFNHNATNNDKKAVLKISFSEKK